MKEDYDRFEECPEDCCGCDDCCSDCTINNSTDQEIWMMYHGDGQE